MQNEVLSKIVLDALESKRTALLAQLQEVEEAIKLTAAKSGAGSVALQPVVVRGTAVIKAGSEKPVKEYAIEVLRENPEGMTTNDLLSHVVMRGARCKDKSSLYGILARYKDDIKREGSVWKLASEG